MKKNACHLGPSGISRRYRSAESKKFDVLGLLVLTRLPIILLCDAHEVFSVCSRRATRIRRDVAASQRRSAVVRCTVPLGGHPVSDGIRPPWGRELETADYQKLAARWITPELANAAGLRRVDSEVGKFMFSRKRGDLSGIIIPNVAPWEPTHIREYRERVDNPPLEYRADGTTRQGQKYVQPPGRPNLLYFPPGITMSLLEDVKVPIIITEGEFKALALHRLAMHQTATPRFIAVAVAGVWNWRGTVGKAVGVNGQPVDVHGVIPDLKRISWKRRQSIIAFDADADENAKVRAARWGLNDFLLEQGASVGILTWPLPEGKGIDDRLVKVGAERVLADIEAVEFGSWRTRLLRSERGRLLPCHENVALFLLNSPEWAGVLGLNEFTGGYTILKPPPAPVTAAVGSELEDYVDTQIVRWLDRRGLIVSPDLVRRVIDDIARRHTFHPVREYLEGLHWDGVPRISTWLMDYCGVSSSDSDPNEYAMAVGEKFLISAVARVMEPGVKCDCMPVFEGPQGAGKSTALRTLAGDEWFTDKLEDMGSKDASMQLRGKWIIELSELDALNRAEHARAKAFITQQAERFRPPYGRRVVEVPRQCVFAGTTNSDAWLTDETGGRRFWPVHCKTIDLDGLRRDRDQLWAEALARYREGVPWWLDDPRLIALANEEQRNRYQADVWQDLIASWLVSRAPRLDDATQDSVSIDELLLGCIGKSRDQWTQRDKKRVAGCLRSLGWKRYKHGRGDGKREWRYRKSSET
jgi:hypothetical protein